MTYSVVVFGTGLGLLLLWYLLTSHIGPSVFVLTGVCMNVLVTGVLPVASYLYAVRRDRQYTVG